jgi:hypothetical protein
MNRIALVALLVAGCSKSDSPAPAAKATPSETAKASATAGTTATTPTAATAPTPTASRPASVTDAHVATIDKLLTIFSDLGTMLDLAKTCDQKRSTLVLATSEFAELQPELVRTLSETNADPAAEAWFDATYKPRLEAATLPLKKSAEACKDDPGFMKALANLPMMKKKS